MSARFEVRADDRDFPPAWHLKVLAVCAVVLAAMLPLAFKLFLE